MEECAGVEAAPSQLKRWSAGLILPAQRFAPTAPPLPRVVSPLVRGRMPSLLARHRYGLDGSGARIPVGGEIFRIRPDRPWDPPSLLYNGYRLFPGGTAGRDVTLTTHLHHRGLRKSRSAPLGLLGCSRANFYLLRFTWHEI